jgi:hypothetical protein
MDMMEDLADAGVPLEEYNDDEEDAADMWMDWQCFDHMEVVIEILELPFLLYLPLFITYIRPGRRILDLSSMRW